MNNDDSLYEDELRARRAAGHDAWAVRGRRFVRWLKAQPAECWLFLVVGLIVGGVFL